ncbi:MAG TPA: HAMP domain-containing sensor histidine kinase [Bacteroidales bacterium]|nr:HAMP domain-containing sensor histidine kinase [Bacteroidales bacterium]
MDSNNPMPNFRELEQNSLEKAFLKNLNHELRTPMNAIIGFANLIQNHCHGDKEIAELVEAMNFSCFQLLNLVNDLVDLSKLETNKLHLHPVKCDLNELMESLYIDYQKQLDKDNKPIELLIYKDDCYRDIFIDIDRARFTQIWKYIIDNAMKFTHIGKIEFGYMIRGRGVHCYVKDTGIGMPQSSVKMVFEQFVRNSNCEYGGLGIGLTIARKLIELMEGHIWIDSEQGKGTIVYFTVPVEPENKKKKKDELIDKLIIIDQKQLQ